jgi:hypothetical protein
MTYIEAVPTFRLWRSLHFQDEFETKRESEAIYMCRIGIKLGGVERDSDQREGGMCLREGLEK